MTNTAEVTNIEDELIIKGQEANAQIDKSTASLRKAWLDLGLALLIGRKKNKGNKDYNQWIKANGFDNRSPRDRSAALWFAENQNEIAEVFGHGDRTEMPTHPRRIQEAYNKLSGNNTSASEKKIKAEINNPDSNVYGFNGNTQSKETTNKTSHVNPTQDEALQLLKRLQELAEDDVLGELIVNTLSETVMKEKLKPVAHITYKQAETVVKLHNMSRSEGNEGQIAIGKLKKYAEKHTNGDVNLLTQKCQGIAFYMSKPELIPKRKKIEAEVKKDTEEAVAHLKYLQRTYKLTNTEVNDWLSTAFLV